MFNIDNNFDYYDDGDDGIVLMLHQKSRQREHFEEPSIMSHLRFQQQQQLTTLFSLFKAENDAQLVRFYTSTNSSLPAATSYVF